MSEDKRGRKSDPNSKAGKIREFLKANPNATAAEVEAATGLPRKYIYGFVKTKKKKPTKVVKVATPQLTQAEEAVHPLIAVFAEAVDQAMYGKGTRHGGTETPFLEQPWLHYAKLHGRGFLTGQAAKKLEEAASIKDGEAFVHEALGAAVYIAMAVWFERNGDGK